MVRETSANTSRRVDADRVDAGPTSERKSDTWSSNDMRSAIPLTKLAMTSLLLLLLLLWLRLMLVEIGGVAAAGTPELDGCASCRARAMDFVRGSLEAND